MSRDLPTGMATAAAAVSIAPIYLAELDWSTGTARAWTGYGNLSWSGHTWFGTGELGRISEVKETADGAANGVTLALSGIPSANLAEAMDDASQGKPARIWLGFFDFSTGTIAQGPYLIFDGFIDVTNIEDDGETASVSVQIEKEMIDRRAGGRRYTHEDQQIDSPGDLFFQYMAVNSTVPINWGVPVPSSQATSGGGNGKRNNGILFGNIFSYF